MAAKPMFYNNKSRFGEWTSPWIGLDNIQNANVYRLLEPALVGGSGGSGGSGFPTPYNS